MIDFLQDLGVRKEALSKHDWFFDTRVEHGWMSGIEETLQLSFKRRLLADLLDIYDWTQIPQLNNRLWRMLWKFWNKLRWMIWNMEDYKEF